MKEYLNYYVYYKDLMDEETFKHKIQAYPTGYKKEHWKKVRVVK